MHGRREHFQGHVQVVWHPARGWSYHPGVFLLLFPRTRLMCLNYEFYGVLGMPKDNCGNNGAVSINIKLVSMILPMCWLLTGQQGNVRRCVRAPRRHLCERIPIAQRGGASRVRRHSEELLLARHVCHWPQRRICWRWCSFCFLTLFVCLFYAFYAFSLRLCNIFFMHVFFFTPAITLHFLYRSPWKCAYQRPRRAQSRKGRYIRYT